MPGRQETAQLAAELCVRAQLAAELCVRAQLAAVRAELCARTGGAGGGEGGGCVCPGLPAPASARYSRIISLFLTLRYPCYRILYKTEHWVVLYQSMCMYAYG